MAQRIEPLLLLQQEGPEKGKSVEFLVKIETIELALETDNQHPPVQSQKSPPNIHVISVSS
ncbi:hypothetical protein KR52_06860 [Synechococcus sp. KORDI-52]|nr:hypothetical protein KR52_06860 [Synechococcus sp. KORDI-52]